MTVEGMEPRDRPAARERGELKFPLNWWNGIVLLAAALAVLMMFARAGLAQSNKQPEGASKASASHPAAKAGTPPDAGAPPGDPVSGAQLFRSVGCSDCHGDNAEGAVGPPLIKLQKTFQQFESQVRKPVGAMPNEFPPELVSEDKLIDIYAYLEHATGSPQNAKAAGAAPDASPIGNAENGKALLASHGCEKCHAPGGQEGAPGNLAKSLPDSLQGLIDYVRHPKGQMPPFAETAISDMNLADIYAYLKTQQK